MNDPISGYHADAFKLAERYETLSTAQVHSSLADLISPGTDRIALDVGAGSGRDAGWLVAQGYDVVAAEPAAAMRAEGRRRHPEDRLRWIDDRLPDLTSIHRLGLAFDLILLSAVWMHVRPGDRSRAFRKLVTLLKPGGLLLLTARNGNGSPDRPMWAWSNGELEALARAHGLMVLRIAQSVDRLGRDDVLWTSIAFQLPDDGSGALPLLRGIILNDDKSSTYKLALIRAVAKIADTAPALGHPRTDEDTVDVPLDLVALNWVRLYLPLVSAGLPQTPGNSGAAGLGFAKSGFQDLIKLGMAGQDLRVGARYTGDRALALGRALAEARRTICAMPVYYTRLPNSDAQVFAATKRRSRRASPELALDAATLSTAGSLSVPGHVWRTLQRLGAWVEPVLITEWSRLIQAYAERMSRPVTPGELDAALRWLDPARDTQLARETARRLMARGDRVVCVWTGRRLRIADLDIDHCLPWSAWPCGDLWNLLPSARRVNQHLKRDRLPSAAALAAARSDIVGWWTIAWEADAGLRQRFEREAAATLAAAPSVDLDGFFTGLEWRRLRLRQDQQVQEWAGVRPPNGH